MSACPVRWCDNTDASDCGRDGHYGGPKVFVPIAPDYCRPSVKAGDEPLTLGVNMRVVAGQVIPQIGLYLLGHELDLRAYLVADEARQLASLLDKAADQSEATPMNTALIRCSRCSRCHRRLRQDNGWNVTVQAGVVVGYLCPDCQTPGENAEAEVNEATTVYGTDQHGRLTGRIKGGVVVNIATTTAVDQWPIFAVTGQPVVPDGIQLHLGAVAIQLTVAEAADVVDALASALVTLEAPTSTPGGAVTVS